MPPKEKKYKGGLFDPSSVSLQLMKTSEVQYLTGHNNPNPTNDASAKYSSRNYMNVPPAEGGEKSGKKALQKKNCGKKALQKKWEKINLRRK